MVNIWNYADAEKIQITCISGDIYEGNVVCIDDAEEMYDATEDEITIETSDGKFVGFKPSEIEKIRELNK